MPDYIRPATIEEAVAALATRPLTVLAGGTDIYPAHVEHGLAADILDISGISSLRGIAESDAGWRLGATTTWSDLIGADLPPLFDGLKLAAREVGGVQIQNAATLAGNLCNASPAADGIPALLALDAEVELTGPGGVARMALAEFVRGNRETARQPDQLVSAVLVPRPDHTGMRGDFLKLGARRYLVISIAMVGATLALAEGKVAQARIAVGACSAVARRLPELEAALVGREAGPYLRDVVEPEHLDGLAPIDDARASADYRRDAALVLVRRILGRLGGTP